jgi:hypothetical protein
MKKKLIPFSVLLFSMIFINQSCKKIDSPDPNSTNPASRKFFTVSPGTDTLIDRVIEGLKQQNKLTGFIDELAEKEGYAVWNKSMIEITPNTVTTQTNLTGSHITGNSSDTILYIPLVLENTRYVNSFIYATLNGNITLKLFRGREYEMHGFDTTKKDNAALFTTQLMLLSNKVFGYTNFKINDDRIFPQKSGKHLKNTEFSLRNNSIPTSSYWVTYMAWVTHYGCGGSVYPCTSAYCDMCNVCVTTTYDVIHTWIEPAENSGGGGGIPGTDPTGGTNPGTPTYYPGGGSSNSPCTVITGGQMPASCGNGHTGIPYTGIEGDEPIIEPEETYTTECSTDTFVYYSGPAIDLQKFKNCFDLIPSTGALFNVKICADIPNNSDPNKSNDGTNPGHVFLTMTKTNGSLSVTQSFGFYPVTPVMSLSHLPVISKAVNDEFHEYNASLKMNVTELGFNSIINTAILNASYLQYDINDYNCGNFALDAFNKGRLIYLSIPNSIGTAGHNFGITPGGIYQKLNYMKTHNDPDMNNIDIGNFSSPQSHGPCN